MLRETYEKIKNGVDVRKNLIELKAALKEDSNKIEKTPVDELIDLVGDSLIEYK